MQHCVQQDGGGAAGGGAEAPEGKDPDGPGPCGAAPEGKDAGEDDEGCDAAAGIPGASQELSGDEGDGGGGESAPAAAAATTMNAQQRRHQNCACLGKCFYFSRAGYTMCCVTRAGPSKLNTGSSPGLYPCAECVQGRAAVYIALEESGAMGITEEMKQGLVPPPPSDNPGARCRTCGNFASGDADGLCNACRTTLGSN